MKMRRWTWRMGIILTVIVVGCESKGGGGTPPDTTPPTVTSTSPGNGAAGVPVTTVISADFSEGLVPATIDSSTFSVASASGAVYYTGTTATLVPSAPLSYGTVYTGTITTGVKDAAGNAMAAAYTWTFTTDTHHGILDPAFGIGGVVTSTVGPSDDMAWALAIQSDGRIVVAGSTWTGSNWDFALVRYLTDGTLDSTFGTGGTVTTRVGTGDDRLTDVAIQSDGKIVVTGYVITGPTNEFAVVRYLANGTLDTGFGSGGVVITSFGPGNDYAKALEIQGNGRILVAGITWTGTANDIALARYLTDGTLDSTFGTGGTVTTDMGGSEGANAVMIQPDGRIVVAGHGWNGTDNDILSVRYLTDGTLDTGFGSGGLTITSFGPGNDFADALAIQGDGRIVVAGTTFTGANSFAAARYLADGTLDPSFGNGGTVTTSIGSSALAYDLQIQADGKIVVAGVTGSHIAVGRYLANGSLDPGFGNGGIVITSIGSIQDSANALGIQQDGKIVVAGFTRLADGYYFAVVRYLP